MVGAFMQCVLRVTSAKSAMFALEVLDTLLSPPSKSNGGIVVHEERLIRSVIVGKETVGAHDV